MNISTKSWHYRLIRFHDYDPRSRKSLCSYFWLVVWAFLLTVFKTVVWCTIFYMLGFVTIYLPVSLIWEYSQEGLAVLIFEGIILTVVLYLRFIHGLVVGMLERNEKPRPMKEPGLISSYVKARKSKFCPTLTFETPPVAKPLPKKNTSRKKKKV